MFLGFDGGLMGDLLEAWSFLYLNVLCPIQQNHLFTPKNPMLVLCPGKSVWALRAADQMSTCCGYSSL